MRITAKSLPAILVAAFLVVATHMTSRAQDKPVLTIYTYDSFASEWGPGPKIETAFEARCGCDVNFVALDSSIGILGRVLLEGTSSKADIVLGLDTNLMETARNTGLFAPHGARLAGRTALPVPFDDNVFMPFDWGHFAFIYNSETDLVPPTSMRELVDAPDRLRIVIQDPRTATPGLGLLLWMRAVYGDDAGDAWERLSPKIITVTKSWWDAYSLFLEGEADMVLSYTTSPAYHMVVDGTDKYRAASFTEGHYMQIEVAAMLRNAPQRELAEMFMEFILAPGFQSAIPTANWMYPAGPAALPDAFDALVRPQRSLLFTSSTVQKNKSRWVGEWQSALTR